MMRFIKLFLFGFIGLFIIITLFSLVIPSRIKVSRMVVINAGSRTEIMQQISNLKNWRNWQPLFKSDSARIIYSDKTATEQKHCEILQNGSQTYLDIDQVDSSSVKFTLRSKGESPVSNEISIISLPAGNSLQVEWTAVTKLKWYPWEKFYGIFMDKLTGPGYENSLNGLKDFFDSKSEN